MTARPALSAVYAELEATPNAAHQARALVASALGEGHPFTYDARLAVSELVANAIAHSRSGRPGGTIAVAIEPTRQGDVGIYVRDAGGPGAPVLTHAGPRSEHGRGLRIVAAIAAEWGSHASGNGRTTWCRLTRDRTAAPSTRIAEREAG